MTQPNKLMIEHVAAAIADSNNEPIECLTKDSWARTDAYFVPTDRDRVAAYMAICAIRQWDKNNG